VSRFRYTESIKAFLFMSGWIKVHRKVQDHWIFKEQREFSRFEAWLDMLLCLSFFSFSSFLFGSVCVSSAFRLRFVCVSSAKNWLKRDYNKPQVKVSIDPLVEEMKRQREMYGLE